MDDLFPDSRHFHLLLSEKSEKQMDQIRRGLKALEESNRKMDIMSTEDIEFATNFPIETLFNFVTNKLSAVESSELENVIKGNHLLNEFCEGVNSIVLSRNLTCYADLEAYLLKRPLH